MPRSKAPRPLTQRRAKGAASKKATSASKRNAPRATSSSKPQRSTRSSTTRATPTKAGAATRKKAATKQQKAKRGSAAPAPSNKVGRARATSARALNKPAKKVASRATKVAVRAARASSAASKQATSTKKTVSLRSGAPANSRNVRTGTKVIQQPLATRDKTLLRASRVSTSSAAPARARGADAAASRQRELSKPESPALPKHAAHLPAAPVVSRANPDNKRGTPAAPVVSRAAADKNRETFVTPVAGRANPDNKRGTPVSATATRASNTTKAANPATQPLENRTAPAVDTSRGDAAGAVQAASDDADARRVLPVGVRIGRMPPRAQGGRANNAPVTAPVATPARVNAEIRAPRAPADTRSPAGDKLVAASVTDAAFAALLENALLSSGLTVAVEPSPELLRDRYHQLAQRTRGVVRFEPELRADERGAALEMVRHGANTLVLATAQELLASDLVEALAKRKLTRLVLGQAQSLSEQSHDFYAGYRRAITPLLGPERAPITAVCTAAPAAVRRHVSQLLGLTASGETQGMLLRPSIGIDVIDAPEPQLESQLLRVVSRQRAAGVVFSATPRGVERIAEWLRRERYAVYRYHSDMSPGERAAETLKFLMPGSRAIMVATSAFGPNNVGFGLGVQKKDIRFVVHDDAPASLEQYVLDLAAVGRDGARAHSYILHDWSASSERRGRNPQFRIAPQGLLELCKLLEQRSVDGGAVSTDAIGRSLGMSQRMLDTLVLQLTRTGLVSTGPSSVRLHAAPGVLRETCLALINQLETVAERDRRRADSVLEFLAARRCRVKQLADYFGVTVTSACAGCDQCGRAYRAEHSVEAASDSAGSDPAVAPRASSGVFAA